MAKKEKKKKVTSKRNQNYEVAGSELKRKNKFCPKCGVGIFLAEHQNRLTCGQCGYTEMKSKVQEPSSEPKEKKEK